VTRGRQRAALAALLLWLAPRLSAQGGPPLVTDDPGTPEAGHWEINLAWTREHRPGETSAELPLVDINYGWSERVQLKYEVPRVRETGEGTGGRSGAGDSLAGVKWRFHDGAPGALAASVYPQLGFRTSGAAVRRGISAGGTMLILPLELQKSFGSFSANADVGFVRDTRAAESWFGGFAVGYEHADWEWLAEVHAEAEVGAPAARVLLNGGVRRKLGEHATLLFSVGREIRDRTEARATAGYLGLQLTR
jgi:hypothetical protein